MTVWLAEEWAELKALPSTWAFEPLFALTTVTWLVLWLNEPNAKPTASASRSGRTSPVWASSSCMLSSDMMLPFFFLFRFPTPTSCGHRGVAHTDLRSGEHVPNQAGNLA